LDQERILREVDDRIRFLDPLTHSTQKDRLPQSSPEGSNSIEAEQRRELLAAQALESHLRRMEEAQADQEVLMSNLREQEALKQKELENRLRLEAQARSQEEQRRAEAEKKLAELQSRLVAQERQKSIEVEAALEASR
jgi:hypothetical protein